MEQGAVMNHWEFWCISIYHCESLNFKISYNNQALRTTLLPKKINAFARIMFADFDPKKKNSLHILKHYGISHAQCW